MAENAAGRMVQLNATAAVMLVEPNERRTALLIGPPAAGQVFLGWSPTDPTASTGFAMALTGGPLLLSHVMHGAMVRRGWWAIASAGTPTIGVFESFE